MSRLGVDTSLYNATSAKAGGATAAVTAGVNDKLIQQFGGWKSNAFRAYVRPDENTLHSVQSSMFASVRSGSISSLPKVRCKPYISEIRESLG